MSPDIRPDTSRTYDLLFRIRERSEPGVSDLPPARTTGAAPDLPGPGPGPDAPPDFLGLCADPEDDRLLLGIGRFGEPFLLMAALSHGAGSSALGLDRGKAGKVKVAEFRRIGGRVLLVLRNKHHLATGDAAAVRAGEESFATSVVWSAPVLRERDGAAVVDATGLALTDFHGIAEDLRAREQGAYEVDPDASFPLAREATTGPGGTRLPALLTLRALPGTSPGAALRDVVPAPRALSVVQQLHLVPLPDPAMRARRYHPASGAYGIGHDDHGAGTRAGTQVKLQPRFRLEPAEGEASVGAPVAVRRPIVFLIDPAVPEPVRGAVVEGGNWWRDAFERAGFRDAFRVEVAPAGPDDHDLGVNSVRWVHRDGRGWSHGQGLTDPRTGEIICGRVRLGSQRVEQITALAEALHAPYGKADESERLAAVEALVLSRMRQLAAHEIGHALGFMHNFASTHHPSPSVMDYPHPRVTVGPDGRPDSAHAYPEGLGPWDHFLVAHAYGRFPGEDEDTALARLRRTAAERGLLYVTDEDARGPEAAHADAVVWVAPVSDAFAALDEALAVRRAALDGFSRAVLPPGRQTGELEERAVLLQLYHRSQLAAVARLVGGVRYGYGLAGEDGAGTVPVGADIQRRALDRLAELLRADQLALPAHVLSVLTPPAIRYERTAEYFDTRAGRVFDPFAAVEATVALVTRELLDPARLNRLGWQHAADPAVPSPGAVVDTLLRAAWRPADPPSGEAPDQAGAAAVQETAGWAVLRAVLGVMGGDVPHATVRAGIGARLRLFAEEWRNGGEAEREAARTISGFLAGQSRAPRLGPEPRVPPGAPI
ncbi:zinc-dependent metalloprotease [Streptomyces sp. NPDC091212]|uniref:zinc-dependent metalloprotease n=1 Tax=Streptomyces sp. NPDC091212 TaxID=3155191 RepID=UPI00342A7AE9